MSHRSYDIEFKLNAINLIKEKGLSISQASRDLGVPKSNLHKWIRGYGNGNTANAFPGKGKLKPEDEQLKKLQRENEVLRRERDILKKALAIFSST
jgi:transposase